MLFNISLLSICHFCHAAWLLPLLLLSFLLGWLFEYLKRQGFLDRIDALQQENNNLNLRITEGNTQITNLKYKLEKSRADYESVHSKNADLDIKLRACGEQRSNLETELRALQNVADTDTSVDSALGFHNGEGIKNTMTTPHTEVKSLGIADIFEPENLQIIEGVGPKIESLLQKAGYKNWSDIGNAKIVDLQKVLDDAGARYRVHNPKTWPEQARLAADDNWDALIQFQKFLDTETDNTENTPSKVEKLYAKKIGFASFKPNDMKIIEGVGPKIAGLINDAGIMTWAELAVCPVERIQEILTAAGGRYRLANPQTWPKQAALAANGNWTALKAYQDALDGGRE